jgi:thiol:disulfide interchange protein DsbD
MRLFDRLLNTIFFSATCALSMSAGAQISLQSVLSNELVRAELLAFAPDGADAGKTVWLGLQLKHQPEWHTYWKNSGDSGQPTTLSWSLPAGVTAGDIAWPLPKKIPIGNLANYGYDGTVLLPVPLHITSAFKPAALKSTLDIELQASWLVCKQECVPQEGKFALNLPVKGSTALNAADFDAAFQLTPKPLKGESSISIQGNTLHLSVSGLPATLQSKTLEFFPENPEVIETAARWSQSWQNATWTARVPISPQRLNSPGEMTLVLAAQADGERMGFISNAKVSGAWPSQAAAGSAPTMPSPLTKPTAPAVSLSFWAALVGALLGGMLLNLMPCVFPVLAIKVISFTRHAESPRGQRISGLAYSAGVVLSFMALGALILTLRGAGEQLGWGFQLQSPLVVAALATLFTVMGLNLAGLFEFGQFVPSSIASLEAKNPSLNAFLSGVLAVLIASPCTAPFMGASLGLALSLPTPQALAIFAAIGVGMALPYLGASWSPALASLLPRPGQWMNTFRQAMAFPMFATVIWLVWVLGQQSGINGASALLALLLGLALLLWALQLQGRSGRIIATFSVVALALLASAIGQNILQENEAQSSTNSSPIWQAWTPGKTEQLLASGAPVFIDFTAAGCVTCQYTKKTTLADTDVLADFASKKVVLLRADWTRRDPAISQALADLGRSGVPVYVLAAPGRAPVLFSEILSASALRQALAEL